MGHNTHVNDSLDCYQGQVDGKDEDGEHAEDPVLHVRVLSDHGSIKGPSGSLPCQ